MKIHNFKQKKQQQDKICMLTCYDYPSARMIADSAVDCVLVGDSVAMVVHGFPNTLHATLDMMCLHTAAVSRGLGSQFLVADMPFLAHRSGHEKTIKAVKALLRAGAHAVKIEGGDQDTLDTINFLVQSGIPVMGHIGLTPQSIHQLGGNRVQGKESGDANALTEQALKLESAGCFALVIECVPKTLGASITHSLKIPTIGIGAGMGTDGQVLVWHDTLGLLQTDHHPRFIKQFGNAHECILNSINSYAQAVKTRQFPADEHTY